MNRIKLLIAFTFLLAANLLKAQTNVDDFVVNATAIVQTSPPKITLNWTASSAVSYTIFRKLKTEQQFGSAIGTVAGTGSTFIDNNVKVGIAYDYLIQKTTSSYYGFGELDAGIEIPLNDKRGNILLVIDSAIATSITSELKQYKEDLIGDGWKVSTVFVSSTMKVPAVKSKIAIWYNADKTNNKAAMLIGHIPVPYSGLMDASNNNDFPPDGHPDHGGAWPTDLYYAEFDGTWTDAGTSVSGLSRTENMNAPGDGKFDQHHLPNDVDIQIGRIDLSSLPIFSKTEKELMQQYFAKDHQYRQRLVTVSNRALICETLGLLGGEAPGRTCSMNFNPLFSSAKTESVNGTKYFDTLKKKDYLFSAVTSYAGYNTLLSVGAVDRYKDSIHSVFNTTFGSYHGDWDNSNNMMRGCLGSPGLTLTNVWSGRPVWHFLHMGLGENIGYSALVSQNNNSYYYAGAAPYRIHTNLMGDLSLRLHMILPVINVVVTAPTGADRNITWSASADNNIAGYLVYRASDINGDFTKLTSTPVTQLSFYDDLPNKGLNIYMIRAVRLEQTPTGSYYNLSQGSFATNGYSESVSDVEATDNIAVFPNPASGQIFIAVNDLAETATVKLSDISGKSILTKEIKGGSAMNAIDVSSYERGVYIINISSGGKVKTMKIVLQ